MGLSSTKVFSGLTSGFCLYLIIAASFIVIETVAQEELLCKGQKLNMTDKQVSFITECLQEFKLNSIWDIPVDKMACFGVCCLDKKGLLTADGRLDHDKIYDYVYHVMQPEEVRKPLVEGTEACIKDHGQAVRIPDDPSCTQYFEAGQCVHLLFHEVCMSK